MDKIKRFIECLIPVTACNLKCSYCYVIQRNNRKMKMAELKYTPEQIGRALNKERWGGTCYFSICGAGETTMQEGIEDIVFRILEQGHYVNITTNGTLKKQLIKIVEKSSGYIHHLHFAFSFHYLELKRTNKLDEFFDNIDIVRGMGASVIVQFNMCDEYIPYFEEMNRLCIERTGASPQVAATRKEQKSLRKIELLTNYSIEEYRALGEEFNSPLFDFTMKNFNVKRREFCYAGDWSAILDLSTGIMRRCYSSYMYQDVIKNPDSKIKFLAIGKKCGSPFCMNSSHFMSLGVIPSVETPTYEALRNRETANWYNKEMREFLSGRLSDSNEEYGFAKRELSNIVGMVDAVFRNSYKLYKKIRKR